MSYIKNPDSYNSLPHIFLINSDFDLIDIGIYDPIWDVVSGNYISGKLVDENGNVYPDKEYDNKNCTILRFEHFLLGNYPVLCKIGKPHIHEKTLISTNETPLDEVKTVDKKRNIFYFANLKTKPFIVNGGEYALYELEPHLNPDELKRVRNDTNTIADMKNKMVEAVKAKRKAEAESFVTNASLVGAELHIKTLETYVEQYGMALDELSEQAIQLGFAKAEIVSKSIKSVESKFDLQLNWRNELRSKIVEDTDTKAKNISKFFSNIEAYKNDKTLTDTMKEYMVDVIVDICGMNYVKKRLDEISSRGMIKDNNDSLLANNIRTMEASEKGTINPERADEMMRNALQYVYQQHQLHGDMQKAINEANNMYPRLTKQNIQQEVQNKYNELKKMS